MSDTASVDIEALEKLARAATPGPWFADGGTLFIDTREQVCCGRGRSECCGNPDVVGDYDKIADSNPADAAFIAAANPQAILTLSARNRELEEALKEARRNALEEAAIYFRRKQGDFTGLEIAEIIRNLTTPEQL